MKIVINTLEQIAGVEIFPIISLIIFFTLFAGVAYLVLTADKKYIDEMKQMPLDENDDLHYDNNQIN
jgi:hypothetical protein